MTDISTPTARERLAVRGEPYWHIITEGLKLDCPETGDADDLAQCIDGRAAYLPGAPRLAIRTCSAPSIMN